MTEEKIEICGSGFVVPAWVQAAPLLLLLALLLAALPARHAWAATANNKSAVELPVNQSRVIDGYSGIAKVSIGNPGIADILVMRGGQIYVLGKRIGTTNVLLWDRSNQLVDTITVDVTYDLHKLKQTMHQLLPGEKIEIRGSQNSIILSGSVTDPSRMDAALRLAKSFLYQAANGEDESQGSVLNLMKVGGAQQVMLSVKVAEIRREELRRFGVKFYSLDNASNWKIGGVSGGATVPDALFAPDDLRIPIFPNGNPIGPVVDEFMPNDLAIGDKGLLASFLSNDFALTATLEMAKNNGVAKILAEPTLTTLTGQEAVFLAGGEFPIPVPDGNRGITIQFKEFGVGLKFLPVVLDEGRINLKLDISVSELINANAVNITSINTETSIVVPALAKRSAQSTVELADGQTIGIAGLINENLRQQVDKFPGLSSIPVLGNMFRSQEWVGGETELLILVTPRLARPLPEGPLRLPTDAFVEPTDVEWYLQGRLEGRDRSGYDQAAAGTGGGSEGDFGHVVE